MRSFVLPLATAILGIAHVAGSARAGGIISLGDIITDDPSLAIECERSQRQDAQLFAALLTTRHLLSPKSLETAAIYVARAEQIMEALIRNIEDARTVLLDHSGGALLLEAGVFLPTLDPSFSFSDVNLLVSHSTLLPRLKRVRLTLTQRESIQRLFPAHATREGLEAAAAYWSSYNLLVSLEESIRKADAGLGRKVEGLTPETVNQARRNLRDLYGAFNHELPLHLQHLSKLIRVADQSEFGWQVARQFFQNLMRQKFRLALPTEIKSHYSAIVVPRPPINFFKAMERFEGGEAFLQELSHLQAHTTVMCWKAAHNFIHQSPEMLLGLWDAIRGPASPTSDLAGRIQKPVWREEESMEALKELLNLFDVEAGGPDTDLILFQYAELMDQLIGTTPDAHVIITNDALRGDADWLHLVMQYHRRHCFAAAAAQQILDELATVQDCIDRMRIATVLFPPVVETLATLEIFFVRFKRCLCPGKMFLGEELGLASELMAKLASVEQGTSYLPPLPDLTCEGTDRFRRTKASRPAAERGGDLAEGHAASLEEKADPAPEN